MKYKYSIIITMYNSEKTIIKCIKSVLSQKKNFEIIIIDDGSTDLSCKIVLNFIKKNNLYKLIKYKKLINKGVSYARNYGISMCQGDYFIFLDSDDELFSNSLINIDNYLKNHNVDLLKCCVKCYENKKYDHRFDMPYFDNVEGVNALVSFCESNNIFATPWSYVISRKIFLKQNLLFLENTLHEDYGLIPILIFNSKKVSSIKISLYKYIKRDNSIVSKSDNESEIIRMNDFILHTYNLVDYFLNSDMSFNLKLKIIEYYNNRLNIKYNNLSENVKKNINISFKNIVDEIIKKMNNDISYKIDKTLNYYKFSNFPLEYKITLKVIVQLAINCFKENLYCIILGGSAGKNNVIVGCSDLDIYILLNKYDITKISFYSNMVEKFKIHIGLTIYSKKEFENGWIDDKTKIMIYEKQNYSVNPTLYGYFISKKIRYKDIVLNDKRKLPNILHECRRLHINMLNSKNIVDKKYLKKIFLLIKCYLNANKIFSFGYKKVYNDFLINIKEKGEEIILTKISNFDIIYMFKNYNLSQNNILTFGENVINFIGNQMMEEKWKKE